MAVIFAIINIDILSSLQFTVRKSLFVLQDIVQAADVGQDLDHKLVAAVEGQLGVTAPTNPSGRPGDTAKLVVSARSECLGLKGCEPGFKKIKARKKGKKNKKKPYMVVPGVRVVPCEHQATSSATSNMRSL